MIPSPEERAALRASHPLRPPGVKGALEQCGVCWRRWPCPTIRLLDALDAIEQREKRSEWREGIVNVLDHEGNYLGCMGQNEWLAALREGRTG